MPARNPSREEQARAILMRFLLRMDKFRRVRGHAAQLERVEAYAKTLDELFVVFRPTRKEGSPET